MYSNEILSLQFGHYSNFIGAHWWNIQENGFQYDPDSPSEIDHDVLFREGLTLKNEVTFTPRLLLVDLKGSLRALPEHGELYHVPEENIDPESLELRAEEKVEKNEFQSDLSQLGSPQTKKIYDLDSEVQVWSDFLFARFHPRTVNIVKEYQHSSDNTPFDIYPLGTNLWKGYQFSEDFVDKIRNYVEECNRFQGFQILLDSIDGFSGLSTSCIEYLRDEYDTKSILGFPVNVDPTSKNPLHLLNLALCYDALSEHSSLFVPLAPHQKFEFISHKPDFPYHSSAILASTLDTLTLNHRMKNSQHHLIDMCTDFSSYGRKAAAASVSLPFPLKIKEDFIDCLNNWEGPLVQSVTPNCQIENDKSLQLVVLRGVPESRLKRPPQVATTQRDMPAYRCDSLKEMLSYFMACTCYGTKTEVTVCKEQMPVKTPFPKFFHKRVGKTGDVDLSSSGDGDVESVNVLAGLHNGKFVGNMFEVLSKELEKIKYKRFHQFVNEGIENDQFKECFDHILDLKDCYEDNYLI